MNLHNEKKKQERSSGISSLWDELSNRSTVVLHHLSDSHFILIEFLHTFYISVEKVFDFTLNLDKRKIYSDSNDIMCTNAYLHDVFQFFTHLHFVSVSCRRNRQNTISNLMEIEPISSALIGFHCVPHVVNWSFEIATAYTHMYEYEIYRKWLPYWIIYLTTFVHIKLKERKKWAWEKGRKNERKKKLKKQSNQSKREREKMWKKKEKSCAWQIDVDWNI